VIIRAAAHAPPVAVVGEAVGAGAGGPESSPVAAVPPAHSMHGHVADIRAGLHVVCVAAGSCTCHVNRDCKHLVAACRLLHAQGIICPRRNDPSAVLRPPPGARLPRMRAAPTAPPAPPAGGLPRPPLKMLDHMLLRATTGGAGDVRTSSGAEIMDAVAARLDSYGSRVAAVSTGVMSGYHAALELAEAAVAGGGGAAGVAGADGSQPAALVGRKRGRGRSAAPRTAAEVQADQAARLEHGLHDVAGAPAGQRARGAGGGKEDGDDGGGGGGGGL
jgi:hypothetical protein